MPLKVEGNLWNGDHMSLCLWEIFFSDPGKNASGGFITEPMLKSTKEFIFQEPWQNFQFPHACNNFCDFLPLKVKVCIFSWPHTVVATYSCSSVFTVLAVGKTSLFNILFMISRPGFSMWELIDFTLQNYSLKILFYFFLIFPLSSADLRGFWEIISEWQQIMLWESGFCYLLLCLNHLL